MTPNDEINLAQILGGLDLSDLRKNVQHARKELSIQNNYQPIVNFYMEIIST